ncbi:hypothetical protein GCM10022247_38250 [Allokutzneria multivorans]|uniref:Nucleic acid/nucleotide deaminase of polymorphic system toxin n=1 Tax=Allokutzneria multivorans TaxID=1142134 RepID=A0ABP7SHZ1_9PSEU
MDNVRHSAEVAVPETVQRWITQLGIDATIASTQQQAPVTPSRMSPAEQQQTLERLRKQLPPPVEAGSGVKTHGRWMAADGAVNSIVSGRDADSDHVDRLLLKRGLPARRRAARSADVELKLAARMVETGTRHVTVVINHRPCVGPYGCDTLVPIVLPPEYTLTVLGSDGYRETFEGGATPWWSR